MEGRASKTPHPPPLPSTPCHPYSSKSESTTETGAYADKMQIT